MHTHIHTCIVHTMHIRIHAIHYMNMHAHVSCIPAICLAVLRARYNCAQHTMGTSREAMGMP